MNDDIKRKVKKVARASYRFDSDIFNDFRALCKENNFNQTKVLEKLMKEFKEKFEEDKKSDSKNN